MFWTTVIAFALFVLLGGVGLYVPAALVVVAFFMIRKRVIASRRLATLSMLDVASSHGLPLDEAFEAYADNFRGGRRAKLRKFADRIASGGSLADAVAKGRGLLSARGQLAVAVGEETGTTAESIAAAAAWEAAAAKDVLEDRSHLGFYLMAVVWICASVVGFINFYIVPKYREIFNGFGTELPPSTTWLIDWHDSPLAQELVKLATLCTLIAYFFVWRRRDAPSAVFGLFGGLRPKLFTAEILRLLAVTADASKPTAVTFDAIAKHHRNGWIRRRMRWAVRAVTAGESEWDALFRAGLISRAESASLDAATRSGTLPDTLRRFARRRDADDRAGRLLAAEYVRPAVIGFFAIVVGLIAVAILAPLIKVIEDLS
ncbi:MAG: type II secretion system F family protein [Planctomycetota bacterium]